MFVTDASWELHDARRSLLAPFRIWDSVAITYSEPCYLVQFPYSLGTERNALDRQMISSVERLLEATANHGPTRCLVYCVESVYEKDHFKIRLEEVSAIGCYRDDDGEMTHFVQYDQNHRPHPVYRGQPELPQYAEIQLLADFTSKRRYTSE